MEMFDNNGGDMHFTEIDLISLRCSLMMMLCCRHRRHHHRSGDAVLPAQECNKSGFGNDDEIAVLQPDADWTFFPSFLNHDFAASSLLSSTPSGVHPRLYKFTPFKWIWCLSAGWTAESLQPPTRLFFRVRSCIPPPPTRCLIFLSLYSTTTLPTNSFGQLVPQSAKNFALSGPFACLLVGNVGTQWLTDRTAVRTWSREVFDDKWLKLKVTAVIRPL